MELRSLPPDERRKQIEQNLCIDLSAVEINLNTIGDANEKNCEQMFGQVPIPVGLAGPLTINGSDVHLPLATTEGALVASVNRGCKAVDNVKVTAKYHGISRSIAFKGIRDTGYGIRDSEKTWKAIGEATSNHLKILHYDIDTSGDYLFLTIYADTSEAMGMNMVTIAAQEIGNWIAEQTGAELITVAGNVDSDKKPSKRTHDRGRGYEITAEAAIDVTTIESILKTTPEKMMAVADAKLHHGSKLAGAIGANLHAANVIAALYLATGQDTAHVVEGSLADTECAIRNSQFAIRVHCPAIIVGTIGGGTNLPAQKQCRDMLLKNSQCAMRNSQFLAEIIGAAVLAGELSLLAAQASQDLAQSHAKMAR